MNNAVTLRPIEGRDFEDAVSLWNETRPSDPITGRVFKRKVLLDVNFNPAGYLIAESAARMEGFIYVVCRRQPLDNDGEFDRLGCINGFGVRDDAPAGTGETLIAAGEAFAAEHGAETMDCSCYRPHYFTQGFDLDTEVHYLQLFLNCGYKGTKESYARDLDLRRWHYPADLLEAKRAAEKDGFRFCPMSDELIVPFWQYMNEMSTASWRIRIRALMYNNDDYGRIRLAIYKDRVIGFNVFGDPDGSPERFGPFSVSSEFRGRKLGQILLAECLYEMKKRGLHSAWMQSTSKNSSADFVYSKAGFVITRRHLPLIKDLRA